MLTNVINMTTASHEGTSRREGATRILQKVVIVNGGSGVATRFEPVLEAGHYDVVIVESLSHAYSQVKRVRPDLVILCLDLDDAEGFRVLSMLKLDPDTRAVPLLTVATEQEHTNEEEPETAESYGFSAQSSASMN